MKMPDVWTFAMYAVTIVVLSIFVVLNPGLSTVSVMIGSFFIGTAVLVVFTFIRKKFGPRKE